MSDLKIEDATPDTDVQGGELIPVSDGGAPKCVSVEQVKDFSLKAVKALAESATTSKNDLVLLKKDGELRLATVSAVAETAAEAMLASEGADEVASGSKYKFIVARNGAKNVLKLEALRNYIYDELKAQLGLDIANGATAYTGSDPDYIELLAKGSGGFWSLSGLTLLRALFKTGRSRSLGISAGGVNKEADSFLGISNASNTIKSFKVKDLGLGDGDVTGPGATVTDGELARFDGTTGKKVKGGISLATGVNSSPSLASDAKVPTEKAVSAAISNASGSAVRLYGSQGATGTIPFWAPGERMLTGGLAAYTQYDGNASTAALACVGFVRGYLSALMSAGGQIYTSLSQRVPRPSSATRGFVPKFTTADGDIGDGYAVTDTVNGGTADMTKIPTATAAYNIAKGAVSLVTSAPADNTTGHMQGEMCYCTAGSGKGLYINTGGATKSAWVKLCAPSA